MKSANSDQTAPMRRLIWVFAGRTSLIVGFIVHYGYIMTENPLMTPKQISDQTFYGRKFIATLQMDRIEATKRWSLLFFPKQSELWVNWNYSKTLKTIHYENSPIQTYWKFYNQKKKILQIKNSHFFSYFC